MSLSRGGEVRRGSGGIQTSEEKQNERREKRLRGVERRQRRAPPSLTSAKKKVPFPINSEKKSPERTLWLEVFGAARRSSGGRRDQRQNNDCNIVQPASDLGCSRALAAR